MALMARVVYPRRPISFGIHILCQSRSTSMGSSPMISGFSRSIVAVSMILVPPVEAKLLIRPVPVMPSSVSILTSPKLAWVYVWSPFVIGFSRGHLNFSTLILVIFMCLLRVVADFLN